MLRKRSVKLITKYYQKAVKDPELCKKLIPKYEFGCKRVTPSNHYLQSYNRDNVSLVTDKIKCFTENGIQTDDGKIHEFDAIVYCTGFDLLANAKTVDVYGRKAAGQENGGQTMEDVWKDHGYPNAYKGVCSPGFPNSFSLLGPGSGLGHNTILFMIECQISFALDAIKNMVQHNIRSMELKKEVNDEFQAWALGSMKNKVQSSNSCVSWYKNADGVLWTIWPSHLTDYWWGTRKVDMEEFICRY